MAIVEITVTPLGTKTPSVSRNVADALRILEKEKDIKYELTPMGTIIKEDLVKVLDLAKKMHEAVFDKEILSTVTIIKN